MTPEEKIEQAEGTRAVVVDVKRMPAEPEPVPPEVKEFVVFESDLPDVGVATDDEGAIDG